MLGVFSKLLLYWCHLNVPSPSFSVTMRLEDSPLCSYCIVPLHGFCFFLFFPSPSILQVARAVDAVALKARAAAVSETYATQGLRSAAILPFTSALGGLCAAASAAAVELLPFVHEKPLQALVAFFFPAAGGFFAAAASVSKSRCEVDAAAAKAASEAFAEAGLTAKDRSEKGALQPFRYVGTLIGLAVGLFFERTWLTCA